MTAHFRVRETVFAHDGTELVAVQWFTADGVDCGHIEVPLDKWCSFIGEASKPWPFQILDRAACACGHEAHVGDVCLAAVYEDGAEATNVYCDCAVEEFGLHAPVVRLDTRAHRGPDVTEAAFQASRAVSL